MPLGRDMYLGLILRHSESMAWRRERGAPRDRERLTLND